MRNTTTVDIKYFKTLQKLLLEKLNTEEKVKSYSMGHIRLSMLGINGSSGQPFIIEGKPVENLYYDSQCFLLCDVDMLAPYLSTVITPNVSGGVDYSFGTNSDIPLLPDDLEELMPVLGSSYKWSAPKQIDVSNLNSLIKDSELGYTTSIYKLYMKDDIPIIEELAYPEDLTITDPTTVNSFVTEILKLNKNIGVAYLLLDDGELSGNMRIRKDTETNEFVVSLS